MDKRVQAALELTPASSYSARTVDITTIGRKTGRRRRIEIWFWRVDGETYLGGPPARPSWYVNLVANPEFTFHLKNGVRADLPAFATPIVDEGERRRIMTAMVREVNQLGLIGTQQVEDWVAGSRLVRVDFAN